MQMHQDMLKFNFEPSNPCLHVRDALVSHLLIPDVPKEVGGQRWISVRKSFSPKTCLLFFNLGFLHQLNHGVSQVILVLALAFQEVSVDLWIWATIGSVGVLGIEGREDL